MTTQTLTIAEFLLARIAEDEVNVCAMAGLNIDGSMDFDAMTDGYAVSARMTHVAHHVLAECEAKRRIVEGMQPYGPIDDISAPEILGLLALPYADHPDYRDEWHV